MESFEHAGFGIVPFDGPADVYVINSCSVTSIAESKSRYTIRRAARYNPAAKILVTGCAAQMALNKGEVLEGADVVVPNTQKLESLRFLLEAFPEFEQRARTEPRHLPGIRGRTRATLKVQDGCSVYCSYCSIPYTRPELRSTPFEQLLEEARERAGEGYGEIVLTGVLIGAYGPGTGSGGPDFEAMVERLARHSGVPRIRISSIEMRQVTPRLIRLLKDGLVVPHLHIPLQSGDSGVLRDMNRPYSHEDYLSLCGRLYREVPDISITTDVMVGFPTETPEGFDSTLRVCEQVRFLKAHVFRFSPRFGTPADRFGDPVSPEEKSRRSLAVSEVSRVTGRRHLDGFLGRTMRVLVEGSRTKEGLLTGLTDNYLTVHFSGPDCLMRNLCLVRLIGADGEAALGEMASAGPALRILA